MANLSMILASVWQTIIDMVSGVFAVIPQTIYFLYASAASILDMLQYVIRKLAGLDVYYVDGKAVEGDIITDFIEGTVGINSNYSIFSTVFWAMVIFGVVLLVFATIIAMIRAHYDYDAKKSSPSYIIGQAVKGLLTMVIIPVVTIFSLYLSEIVLKTLDSITSGANSTTFAEKYESTAFDKFKSATKDGEANGVYGGFDFFGQHYWSNSIAFSSAIFTASAYNANRVRLGQYEAVTGETNNDWSNAGVFWTNDSTDTKEILATQIDTAFEYSLTLKEAQDLELKGSAVGLITSYSGYSTVYLPGLFNVKSFTRFDVGLVWYYYNLWTFDYFMAFAGIITAVILMFNLILGLITRLIYCLALFLIYPPLTGLFPFDNGNAVKAWRTSFTKMFVSVFGTIVAINILCIILPFLRTISLFNLPLLDNIMNALFVLAGLLFVKKAIALFTTMIGAENIEKVGAEMAKDFQKAMLKSIDAILKVAGYGMDIANVLSKGSAASQGKDHKIRKALGKKAFSAITQAERAKYKALKQEEKAAKQAEREEAKVSEIAEERLKEDRQADSTKKNKRGTYATRARKSLEKEKPEYFKDGKSGHKVIDTDKISMADYKKLLEQKETELAKADVREERQERAERRIQARNKIIDLFYQPAQPAKEGEEPPKRELRKGLKAFIDLGGSILKFKGELTQIEGFSKSLKDAGIVDEFINNSLKFAQLLGRDVGVLETKKQKEQREKDEQDKQIATRKVIIETQETTMGEIEKLTDNFKNLAKKRLAKATAAESTTSKKKPPAGGGDSSGGSSGKDDKKDGGSTDDSSGITAGGASGGGSTTSGDDDYAEKKAKAQRSAKRRMAKDKQEAEKKEILRQQQQTQKEMDAMAEKRKAEKAKAQKEEEDGIVLSPRELTDEEVAQIEEESAKEGKQRLEKRENEQKIKRLEMEISKKESQLEQYTITLIEWKSLRETMAIEFEKHGRSDKWFKYRDIQESALVHDAKEQLKRFGVKNVDQINRLEDFDSFVKSLQEEINSLKLELEKMKNG